MAFKKGFKYRRTDSCERDNIDSRFTKMVGKFGSSARKYHEFRHLKLLLIFAIVVVLFTMIINQQIIVDFYLVRLK